MANPKDVLGLLSMAWDVVSILKVSWLMGEQQKGWELIGLWHLAN